MDKTENDSQKDNSIYFGDDEEDVTFVGVKPGVLYDFGITPPEPVVMKQRIVDSNPLLNNLLEVQTPVNEVWNHKVLRCILSSIKINDISEPNSQSTENEETSNESSQSEKSACSEECSPKTTKKKTSAKRLAEKTNKALKRTPADESTSYKTDSSKAKSQSKSKSLASVAEQNAYKRKLTEVIISQLNDSPVLASEYDNVGKAANGTSNELQNNHPKNAAVKHIETDCLDRREIKRICSSLKDDSKRRYDCNLSKKEGSKRESRSMRFPLSYKPSARSMFDGNELQLSNESYLSNQHQTASTSTQIHDYKMGNIEHLDSRLLPRPTPAHQSSVTSHVQTYNQKHNSSQDKLYFPEEEALNLSTKTVASAHSRKEQTRLQEMSVVHRPQPIRPNAYRPRLPPIIEQRRRHLRKPVPANQNENFGTKEIARLPERMQAASSVVTTDNETHGAQSLYARRRRSSKFENSSRWTL